MMIIPLTKGKHTFVDNRDYGYLMQWKWQASEQASGIFYVRRRVPLDEKGSTKSMHRMIMCAPKGMEVDHINHNGLDNRRSNLRLCSHSGNQHNTRLRSTNTSGYKGIGWHKRREKWQVAITTNGIRRYLGYFTDINDAVIARKAAEEKYVGEFAFNN